MTKYLSRETDHLGQIQAALRGLIGYSSLAFELIQNADDAGAASMAFDVRKRALLVENDGSFSDCGQQELSECPWRTEGSAACDFHSFRHVAGGAKRERPDTTGAFGVGFIAVYQITDRPELVSKGRHWIVDEMAEASKRIVQCRGCQKCRDVEGTLFVLPWAHDSNSPLRRALRAPAVPDELPGDLLKALRDSLPSSLLFLRHVDRIEVRRYGRLIRVFERVVDDSKILISDGSSTTLWQLAAADFAEKEEALRARHGDFRIEPKRQSQVTIAIPERPNGPGILSAYLPTEHETGLTLHVNADFYTSSDRKRILFEEDYQAQWNRAALEAGARALRSSVPSLPTFLGGPGLWDLALATWQVHKRAGKDSAETTLQRFWVEMRQALIVEPVMLTSQGEWCRPEESAFLDLDEADVRQALPVLEALGVRHVHPDLRPIIKEMPWHSSLGIQSITIEFLISVLVQAGLDERTSEEELPDALRGLGPKAALWSLVERLLARKRYPAERKTAEDALRTCAIALGRDGALWPCDAVHVADQRTIDLFELIVPSVAFLDPSIPVGAKSVIAHLCRPFDTSAAVEALEEAAGLSDLSSQRIEPVADDLLDWFEAHRHEWEDHASVTERLQALAVYRSPGGLRPLSQLYLPGGFRDPLGLADLVAADFVDRHGPTLRALGAQELSLSTYAQHLVPGVFAGIEQPSREQICDLVEVLARHIGEFADDPEALWALEAIPMVECTDGLFRKPGACYLDEDAIRGLLGEAAPVAVIPAGGHAVRELYVQLGASVAPRPADIIETARELASAPPDDASVAQIQRIVEHLGQELQSERELPEQYRALSILPWLPAQADRERWWKPSELFAAYRAFLFQSQARFLDAPRRIQDRASQTLHLLGIGEEPSPELVVAHLLHLAAEGQAANREIYTFLDNNAEHPSIGRLSGKACLDIGEGQYFRPDQVYWDENPFGSYRRQLSLDLRRYGRLFERLRVRATPSPQDALTVLEEIAAKFGRENEPLEDHAVFWTCWKMLERALEDRVVVEEELAGLSRQKVILDPRGLLVEPTGILFEDWPGVAAEFPPLVSQHIIERPAGAARAMRAAGVANLSESLAIHVVESGGVTENPLATERIEDRRPQIGRIVQHELGNSAWEAASAILIEMQVMSAELLRIQYELEFCGSVYQGSAKAVPAHFDEPSRILYVIPTDGSFPWPSVARELARALAPSPDSISRLASALHGVLSASTREAAASLLDELGFPRLRELEADSPLPAIAEELGQAGIEEAGVPQSGPTLGTGGGTGPVTGPPEPAMGQHGTRTGPSAGVSEGRGAAAASAENGRRGATDGYEGERTKPGAGEKRHGTMIGRLRTYVEPDGLDGETGPSRQAEAHRDAVDHAGISCVERFEREAGRSPEMMPPGNPGYDVVSRDEAGETVRYIEVKSLAGRWALQGAGLTRKQFETARELGEKFWLYVVEHALSDDAKVWAIHNPAVRANQFLFDEGWRALAETGHGNPVGDLDLLAFRARVLVGELLIRGAAPPIVGYEVGPTHREQVWELAAAWPFQQVAILLDSNPQRDSWLSQAGWDARPAEDWTLEELLEKLADSSE